MMPIALCHSNIAQTDHAFSFCREANLSPNPEFASASNVISVDFTHKKMRSSGQAKSDWKRITAERLSRLRQYASGWSGSASIAISPLALSRAGRLLDLAFENVEFPAPPAAVPCADGSLQLEWWLTDVAFELVIEADGSVQAIAENRATDEEVDALDDAAVNLFLQWASRLTADKLIPTV